MFNRLLHTKKTIDALSENELASSSDLFVSCDGVGSGRDIVKVNKVREIVKNINGFNNVTVFEKQNNYGLAKSIIEGFDKIITKSGKVMVIEDDLITSRILLTFMNEALSYYENNEKIFSISVYNFPIKTPISSQYDVYGFYRAYSWGWGT